MSALFRLAGPYITCGHFDMNPGELRLKAYESRIMTTFLAVCLKSVWDRNAANRSLELELCLALASKVSNWSADLERCPIDMTREQAVRLYDDGHQNLDMIREVYVLVW